MLIDFSSLANRYNFKPNGVLHIGAHYGQEAEHYHKLGVEEMVFVEADPDTFKVLLKNIEQYPKATALNVCLSDKEENDVDFNVADHTGQASSLLEFGTHVFAHPEVTMIGKIKVNTKRLDQIPISSSLDFLNIDVQCAEMKVLRGMGDLLKQFKYAYLEVNEKDLYKGCPHVNDIDLFMNGFGFRRVETKMFRHWGWGDAFYMKK